MRFGLLAVTAVFLSPVWATFGPWNPSYDQGGKWGACDEDGKHSKSDKRTGSRHWNHWNHGGDDDDNDDKYGYHKPKICWTKTHAPKTYQTYDIPMTWSKPGKHHKTITCSDTPKYPLPTTVDTPKTPLPTTFDTPPSYTIIPPQPSTELVASSTVPVVVVPTPLPVTPLVPTKPTFTPSATSPPRRGNTTVPFTGDAVASSVQRISLLVTVGVAWLVTNLL